MPMFGIASGIRFVSALAVDTVHAAGNVMAGRQVWANAQRVHIEARGTHRADAPASYLAALKREVGALQGVRWVAVNGILGDVIAEHDDTASLADLRDTVQRVEHDYGANDLPRDRPLHPGGFEPVLDGLIELAGDAVGATLGVLGRVLPVSLPPETMALVAGLDLLPGVRQRLEDRFGPERVEMMLSLAASAIGAAAHSPISSLADAGLRAVELPAALARRRTWEQRSHELTATSRLSSARAQEPPSARPVPLPAGPIETYMQRASTVTDATAAAAALLQLGNVRKAARAVVIGDPKPAKMGSDAFIAELGRTLSVRGALVRHPAALRCLDRVDTVVIDAGALASRETGELNPLSEAVMAAAHSAGKVVVSPKSSGLAERVGADDSIGGGSHLASSVHDLQANGHVVALVGDRNDPAFAAADCAIGIITEDQHPPWAADVLCGPGLEDAWLLLKACTVARVSSNRSVQLAMLGSLCGAVLGLLGPERGAYRRGALPVAVSAFVAMMASVWSVRGLTHRRPPAQRDATPWHAMAVAEALEALRTDMSGLRAEQVAERQTNGDDDDSSQQNGLLHATASELDTPLTAPLAAGAGMSAASGSLFDAVIVSVVMLGNAILGAVQKLAAGRAVRTLSEASVVRATLRRDNREHTAPASELVPGDIVKLEAGDSVPADCRLLEAEHLEVDESSLTGESLPVLKNPAPVDADDLAERASMLYAGTSVIAGAATAVVVSVGDATEAGRSSALLGEGSLPGGVEAQLRTLTATSIRVSVGAAAAMLGIGLLRGRLSATASSAVALAVAAVPEGLPFASTIAQLAAARRLSRRNVLVRAPRTLEALGRVSMVCFDKTGTLTEGRIELRKISDAATDKPLSELDERLRPVLAAALRATPVSTGELRHGTDRALVSGGELTGTVREADEPGWTMVRELPFAYDRGFHAVLGRTNGRQIISVKGAPEAVLPRCSALREDGAVREMTATERERLQGRVDELAAEGFRVLAVAERDASEREDFDAERIERLEFAGLLCLGDLVRSTAAEAVRNLRAAGVEAIMLTGDHPSTAEAIAAELGIRSTGRVITGPEVETLSDTELAELVAESAVFARVTPTHKAAIVRALQAAGNAIAVTGDGANDAPAIRLADVGIALGANSTPAAKQAADIVVTDERIETIVDAVIESRAMWRSVRESVALLVGGNLGEIGYALGSTLLSAQPGLNARQFLAINLLTDLAPALALAARPPRDVTPAELLEEGPDAAVGNALNGELIARAAATSVAALSAWLAARAIGRASGARSVGFATLVGAQLAQTAASAKGDRAVLTATIVSAFVLFVLVQSPASYLFGCRPLGPARWSIVIAACWLAIRIAARMSERAKEETPAD
ncbi:HAD-IC family P-type ATPase [Hoyosella sp. YIM 151337]|uniref:cation-translocating P-type ATPase n=1 Tax=Hoyosella sp. YIM 151337 TaxID=2992742 RepID=UPI0022355F8A|nr:HAD-IC family P-type ATPase [Hoyosella sp. YIM 151337]MCW4356068.1 HAD-IC family P-type ATPase [Hoyosella sp. YIM 151337]